MNKLLNNELRKKQSKPNLLPANNKPLALDRVFRPAKLLPPPLPRLQDLSGLSQSVLAVPQG
jgi:hypothetical protein